MLSQKLYWKVLSAFLVLTLLFSLGASSTSVSAQGTIPPNHIQPNTVRPQGKVDPSAFTNRIVKNGPSKVVIELEDPPAAVVYASAMRSGGTAAAARESVNQVNRIQQAQKTLINTITSASVGARLIYSVQRAYNGVAVTVDPGKLSSIASMRGVKAIHPLISKVVDNAYSVPLIGAPQVWSATTPFKGDGIKIGVIDTGIDYLHTNFGGPGTGYSTGDFTKLGSGFPSAKVVGGWDFAGDKYDANSTDPAINTPVPDPNPMDCGGHGSHVSGTIAGFGVNMDGTTYTGPYTSSVDYTKLGIGPGVAPDAKLYALRVFGCAGSTDLADLAIDWAIDPDQDGDLTDHLDVINMSLGSSYGGVYDSTSVASDNAAMAGVVVVASAGNSGDAYYITGSPSTATRAISVASSQDAGNVFSIGQFLINSPASIAGKYGATEAAFGPDLATTGPVTGDIAYDPANSTACTPLTPATFTGKIALIERGTCTFGAKALAAQDAGAIGVLIFQNAANASAPPIEMGGGDASNKIPAMMTFRDVGLKIIAELANGAVNVTLTAAFRNSFRGDPGPNQALVDLVSSFSSRGPSRNNSFLKPDITAPGDTIFSTAALTGDKGVSMSGTSMAAPHITGVMALLKQIHPDWTVEQLKALAMNTAIHDIHTSGASPVNYGAGREGAGRVDVLAASEDNVVLYNAEDPGAVSVSFGQVDVFNMKTLTKTVRVENKGTAEMTYTPSFEDRVTVPGVTFALLDQNDKPLTTLTVASGAAQVFKVKMTADASKMTHTVDPTALTKAPSGDFRTWMTEATGLILLTPTSGTALRLPVHAVPRPVATMRAGLFPKTEPATGTTFNLRLYGKSVDTTSGGTVLPPTGIVSLVAPFELGVVSPNKDMGTKDAGLEKALDAADIKYVGVTSDSPAQASVVDSEIYFGVASYGNWNSPNEVEFDIYIDTNNDGTPDFVLFNWNLSQATGGADPGDDFVTVLVNLATNEVMLEDYVNGLPPSTGTAGETLDTALFNNNVMVLPVLAADLGLTATASSFTYQVLSFHRDWATGDPVDTTATSTFDPANPAYDFTGGVKGIPGYFDDPSTTIPVKFVGKSTYILLLHLHNGESNNPMISRAEVASKIAQVLYFPLLGR